MKRFGITRKSIFLGEIPLEYGTVLHRTDDNWILLNGQIIFYPFDKFCSENKSKGKFVTDNFLVKDAIRLRKLTLEPGDVLCRTDKNQAKLQNGTIVDSSFYKFCLKKRRKGIFVTDEFKVNVAIPLGDSMLEPGDLLHRAADGMIELQNRKKVYCPFYSFILQHYSDGAFVDWLAKMRRAHCFLLTMYLKTSNINFILSPVLWTFYLSPRNFWKKYSLMRQERVGRQFIVLSLFWLFLQLLVNYLLCMFF